MQKLRVRDSRFQPVLQSTPHFNDTALFNMYSLCFIQRNQTSDLNYNALLQFLLHNICLWLPSFFPGSLTDNTAMASPYPGPPADYNMGVYQVQPGIQPGKRSGTFICVILPTCIFFLNYYSCHFNPCDRRLLAVCLSFCSLNLFFSCKMSLSYIHFQYQLPVYQYILLQLGDCLSISDSHQLK